MALIVVEMTPENVFQLSGDLTKMYEDRPEEVTVCPLGGANARIPTLGQFRALLRVSSVFRAVCTYRDGELQMMIPMDQHRIRACWGIADREVVRESHWAFAAFFEREGRRWTLDTGQPGWVSRHYFRDYAPQDGPFSITARDHPGLGGRDLEVWDDQQWALQIWRDTPDDEWRWEYFDLAPVPVLQGSSGE